MTWKYYSHLPLVCWLAVLLEPRQTMGSVDPSFFQMLLCLNCVLA
jgi:hypothetical protein